MNCIRVNKWFVFIYIYISFLYVFHFSLFVAVIGCNMHLWNGEFWWFRCLFFLSFWRKVNRRWCDATHKRFVLYSSPRIRDLVCARALRHHKFFNSIYCRFLIYGVQSIAKTRTRTKTKHPISVRRRARTHARMHAANCEFVMLVFTKPYKQLTHNRRWTNQWRKFSEWQTDEHLREFHWLNGKRQQRRRRRRRRRQRQRRPPPEQ